MMSRSGRICAAQLDKELARFPWFKPVALEMFGGKFDPALLSFPLNKLAGPAPASDIRDLQAVRLWASSLASGWLAPPQPPASGDAHTARLIQEKAMSTFDDLHGF